MLFKLRIVVFLSLAEKIRGTRRACYGQTIGRACRRKLWGNSSSISVGSRQHAV